MHNSKIFKLVLAALFSALAFLAVFFFRIPVVLFLKYEFKDAVIALEALILGPAYAIITSLVVSLIEMVTISGTGPIGALMNVLSTVTYILPVALLYRRNKSLKTAVTGLVLGALIMTACMLLWNYLITPLYMNVPRQEVAKLLLPAILPFNLLKGTLNSVITFLIYKPVVKALRRAKLVATTENSSPEKRNIGVVVVALLLFVTCILAIFAFRGII